MPVPADDKGKRAASAFQCVKCGDLTMRSFGIVGQVSAAGANLGHENVAQLAAAVRVPAIVPARAINSQPNTVHIFDIFRAGHERGCALIFEARVVNSVRVPHVGARRQGDDARAAGGAQLGHEVVKLEWDGVALGEKHSGNYRSDSTKAS
jgi:hypothetical protein